MSFKTQLKRRISAALGRTECDLLLTNITYLDISSLKWRKGDIAIIDGVIVGCDENIGLKSSRKIDCTGKFLVPGFIDAHVHVESSLLTPSHFDSAVLKCGTTTAVCDPHEIANVMGVPGIEYFLNAAEKTHLDLRVMLSSCVPATHLETNGGGHIKADALSKLKTRVKALGLAEVMNVPGVLHEDDEMLDKLDAFQDLRMDGHCPLLQGKELSAYATTGVSNCHESSELSEAEEKLRKGMAVWIREGSVAKDLKALHPLITKATCSHVGFCTDDRNPLDIASEGHIDHLIRESIRYGLEPELIYKASSWSVANHYGLNRGVDRVGVIAPGYRADLVILNDFKTCSIFRVLKSGNFVDELEFDTSSGANFHNTIKATAPLPHDLDGVTGRVNVIGVRHGRIITDRFVKNHDERGVAKISVLERHGFGGRPVNAYVTGFGDSFDGAIASSVGHDSHNLCTAGSNSRDMAVALEALIASGGGFCVVKDGAILAHLTLPFAGLMSPSMPSEIEESLTNLHAASKSIGCVLPEPFLQLAFLCLPVIPTLKITDKGLVDVDQFKLIDVRV